MIDDLNIPNKISFIKKAKEVSAELGIPVEWLLAVINSETGGTFKSDISNIGCIKTKGDYTKCAIGLIQFMPDTAKSLGTSINELKNMSNVKQLDYVKKYFYPYRNKITRFIDLYLVTFYPVALNKPDSFILGSERSQSFAKKVYQQNKGIDQNGDGLISVGDFKKWIAKNKKIPTGIEQKEVTKNIKVEKFTKRNWLPITLTITATVTGLFLLFKYKPIIIKSLNK
jgi:hypothetical protein